MTFTSTPPTTPGFFAWKPSDETANNHCTVEVVTDFDMERCHEDGGVWCRLVPGEEVELERDTARKDRDIHINTLRYVTAQLIEAGLDDGASPVQQMARRAVAMRKERDQLRAENEQLRRH